MPVVKPVHLISNRVQAIKNFHNSVGVSRAQLDVSGGIDSAVMLMLLARAVGPKNITAVYSGINSSEESLKRAHEVAKAAGVDLIEIDLTSAFNGLINKMKDSLIDAGYMLNDITRDIENDPSILGSIRSCLRAPIGRGFNRLAGGGIRHGTGNECEDRWLRFYQKGGDGEVDTNPIAMLSKGEVYQLALALEVPKSIRAAEPTHDLHDGDDTSHDEVELKKFTGIDWTYSKVDPNIGDYTRTGTIEMLSRFLDQEEFGFGPYYELRRGMFETNSEMHLTVDWPVLAQKAAPYFRGFKCESIIPFLKSAQAIEEMTRHKMNPNCPTLGYREDLLDANIVTDELPTFDE